MPVASSRRNPSRSSSNKKRAADAVADSDSNSTAKDDDAHHRSRKAKQPRLSLPSTISSSTTVNEAKAKRRRQSKQRASLFSKENHRQQAEAQQPKSPGPTPYWKTALERGEMSPPITRSAKKKANILQFSPPNQAENARREAEQIAAQEEVRQRRIEQARANGQLLEFSPTTGRPLQELKDEDSASNKADVSAVEETLTTTRTAPDPSPSRRPQASSFSTSSSTKQQDLSDLTESISHQQQQQPPTVVVPEQLQAELSSLRQGMDQLLQAKTLAASSTSEEQQRADKLVLQAQELHTQTLVTANTKLERTNEQLTQSVQDLQGKLAAEQQAHVVTSTRLEAEVAAAHSQAELRVQALQQIQDTLTNQVNELQASKLELTQTATDRSSELASVQQQLTESQAQLQALTRESMADHESLTAEVQRLQQANAEWAAQVETVTSARDELERQIQDLQRQLHHVEQELLPESESQLQEALNQVTAQKEASEMLEKELSASQALVNQVRQELDDLNRQRQDERESFQQLNEESSKTLSKLTTDTSEKDAKIGELFAQLGQVQQQLQSERAAASETEQRMQQAQDDLATRVSQLQSALEDTLQQLEASERQQQVLESKLTKAVTQLEEVTADKASVVSQQSETSAVLQELQTSLASEQDLRTRAQQDARAKQDRITELEQQVALAVRERDDARQNMQGFNEREAELYRKLHASDVLRRSLHSRVMQLMGNIRVFVRVRPPLESEVVQEDDSSKKRKQKDESPFGFPGVYDRDETTKPSSTHGGADDDLTKNIIEVTAPYKDRGGLSDRRKQWRFGFDNVFSPSHGQDDIWEATEPLVQSAIDGYNVTVFAYGQTGSGKTYTMLGEPGSEGIIARAVTKLFDAKREMQELSKGETKVELSVELLEVYNEQVRDLLAPNSGENGREIPLKVTSRAVVGNVVVPTSSEAHVMKVLALAQKRRCVKATSSNAESSRSHMLFTIHFNVTMKNNITRSGKLNVCDLAGSERLGKSGAHVVGGALLKETQHINKSLSCLSNVIERLQAGDSNVPFRESKLTFLLQNSLGGNSKTLAIVCCNPLASHFHESLCSLRFAAKVNKVDLKSVANFSC